MGEFYHLVNPVTLAFFFHSKVAHGFLRPALDRGFAAMLHRRMAQSIATVTLVVREYDAAIAYYCGTLGFTLLADNELGGGKRWVLVAPDGGRGARLLLARADGAQQEAAIGAQTGGRVMLFLETGDFDRDFADFSSRGVCFVEAPRQEPYGSVAVFEDLYGNRWDLIQARATP